MWDREFGFLREMLVAPVSRTSLVIGKTVGGASVAAIHGLIMLILAPAVGVRLTALTVVEMIGISLLTAFTVTELFGIVVLIWSELLITLAFATVFLGAAVRAFEPTEWVWFSIFARRLCGLALTKAPADLIGRPTKGGWDAW